VLDKYDKDKYCFWQRYLLEYYENTPHTIDELVEKLDCSRSQLRRFTKEHNLIRRDKKKYSERYSFLLYKGDEILYDGTMDEIMENFDISEQRFKWMCTPTAKKRNKGNAMYIKRKYPRKEKLKNENK